MCASKKLKSSSQGIVKISEQRRNGNAKKCGPGKRTGPLGASRFTPNDVVPFNDCGHADGFVTVIAAFVDAYHFAMDTHKHVGSARDFRWEC